MASPEGAFSQESSARFREAPWNQEVAEFRILDERLASNHLARTIRDALTLLDLSSLRQAYAGSGSSAYPPELLLSVILYELQVKRTQPSQWLRDSRENDPVRWLLRGLTPSRTVWYDFRNRLQPEHLLQWHEAILRHAQAQGVTNARSGALDGTSIEANATRHRLFRKAKVLERLTLLEAAVARDDTTRDDTTRDDTTRDDTFSAETFSAETPAEPVPAWMGKTPQRRLQQREQYRLVSQRMDRLHERNQRKRASKRQDPDKIRISVSDSEAAIGYDKFDVFRPLYNVQLLVDLDSPLVLAYEVFAQIGDAGTLGPLLERHRQLNGHYPDEVVADAAYPGGEHLAVAHQANVILIAPWQSNDFTARKSAAKTADAKTADAKTAKKGREIRQEKIPKDEFRWDAEESTYYCPEGHRMKSLGTRSHQRSSPERIELQMYQCPREHCESCPRRSECTSGKGGRMVSRSPHEELIDELRARMKTDEAKAKLRRRGASVERMNADFKTHRGFTRMSGRGLKNARVEIGLLTLSHNLRITAQQTRKAPSPSIQAATPDEIAA